MLVHAGDRISVDQTIAVLDTEKATKDVPSTVAGTIREVMIKVGDKIGCGSLLVMVEPAQADVRPMEIDAAAAPPLTVQPAAVSAPDVQVRTIVSESSPMGASLLELGNLPHASPSIRCFAREYGLNLSEVQGSGPKGRVLQSDLQEFVKAGMASAKDSPAIKSGALDLLPWPQVDFAKFGPIERFELSKIKKISGANLARNSILIPHVTNFDEADITELEAFRVALNTEAAAKNVKLTMLAFLIKASAASLR